MDRIVKVFDNPDFLLIGYLGMSEYKSYFLQTKDSKTIASVELDFQQVKILVDRLDDLLIEIEKHLNFQIPLNLINMNEIQSLELPLESDFKVGIIGLGWDSLENKVVIELLAISDHKLDENLVLSDDNDAPDSLRIFLSPEATKKFQAKTKTLIADNTTSCPLCSKLITNKGHICVRLNGYLGNSIVT